MFAPYSTSYRDVEGGKILLQKDVLSQKNVSATKSKITGIYNAHQWVKFMVVTPVTVV
jgi:hypothetical protein